MQSSNHNIVENLLKIYQNKNYNGNQNESSKYQEFLESTFNENDKTKYNLFSLEQKIILCAIFQQSNLLVELLSKENVMNDPNVFEYLTKAVSIIKDPTPIMPFFQTFLFFRAIKTINIQFLQEREKVEQLENIINEQQNTIVSLQQTVNRLKKSLDSKGKQINEMVDSVNVQQIEINEMKEKFDKIDSIENTVNILNDSVYSAGILINENINKVNAQQKDLDDMQEQINKIDPLHKNTPEVNKKPVASPKIEDSHILPSSHDSIYSYKLSLTQNIAPSSLKRPTDKENLPSSSLLKSTDKENLPSSSLKRSKDIENLPSSSIKKSTYNKYSSKSSLQKSTGNKYLSTSPLKRPRDKQYLSTSSPKKSKDTQSPDTADFLNYIDPLESFNF